MGINDRIVDAAGIIDAGSVETFELLLHPVYKELPVAQPGIGPQGFRYRQGTGPDHIFHLPVVGDGFRPEISLPAHDQGSVHTIGNELIFVTVL